MPEICVPKWGARSVPLSPDCITWDTFKNNALFKIQCINLLVCLYIEMKSENGTFKLNLKKFQKHQLGSESEFHHKLEHNSNTKLRLCMELWCMQAHILIWYVELCFYLIWDLGDRSKAEKTSFHLAQFIPPFVYSSGINAVCTVCWFALVFIHQLLAFWRVS